MQLNALLKELEVLETRGAIPDIDIELITNDSRRVNARSIFIAIAGRHVDGHDFMSQAVERGGRVAIVDHFVDADIAQIRVENPRFAWSALSYAYFGHPADGLDVIAITATNGKTTISFMLDEVLKAASLKTGLLGTVKIVSGDHMIAADMTTPESFELYRYISDMRGDGIDVLTMEASSLALEQSRAAHIPFKVVSFNNFSREHIDQHGSFEQYWRSKASIVTESRAYTTTVINVDDEAIRRVIGAGEGPQLTYSCESQDGDIYAKDIDLSKDYPEFTVVIKADKVLNDVRIEPGEFRVVMTVPGYHTVANAMAVVGMALAYGIAPSAIAEGLRRFHGVERRFEMIYNHGYRILDDHFANVENINVTLNSLSKLSYNRLHMVYAIRGNRGVIVNRESLETFLSWLPKLRLATLIGTETLGAVGPKDLVSPEEKAIYFEKTAQIDDARVTKLYRESIDEAMDEVIKVAEPGDVVMLCGCQGMDMGARVILPKLKAMHPEYAEEIDAFLAQRIC